MLDEAKREHIVQSALDLFAERGFGATSMREIAGRASVPRGTLYEYFPGKEDLLREIAARYLSLPPQALDAVRAAADRNPRAALERLAAEMIRFKTGNDARFAPVYQELLLDNLAHPGRESVLGEKYRQILSRDWRCIREILALCSDRGILAERADLDLEAYWILVLCVTAEDASYWFPSDPKDQYLHAVLQTVSRLLGFSREEP